MNNLLTLRTEKKLCCIMMQITVAAQENSKLWRPFREAIQNKSDLAPNLFYSISRYGEKLTKKEFIINAKFIKCEAIEASFSNCPTGFEEMILEGEIYAVFPNRGFVFDFHAPM
jgi:hypothetical protein